MVPGSAFPGTGRNNATAFVLGGKAYVGTGYDGVTTVDNGYKKDFYQYDPATNKWKAIADFLGGTRQYATSFVANNRAYVGLGYNGSNYYQDFYEYNPATDKWTEIATFIRPGCISGTFLRLGYGDRWKSLYCWRKRQIRRMGVRSGIKRLG
jgi:N-acetylneuraminic acid mutarotase